MDQCQSDPNNSGIEKWYQVLPTYLDQHDDNLWNFTLTNVKLRYQSKATYVPNADQVTMIDKLKKNNQQQNWNYHHW
jgi:hypothetical protein